MIMIMIIIIKKERKKRKEKQTDGKDRWKRLLTLLSQEKRSIVLDSGVYIWSNSRKEGLLHQ